MNVSQENIEALNKSQEAANKNIEASFNSFAKYIGWLSKELDNMSNNCFVGKENQKIWVWEETGWYGDWVSCHYGRRRRRKLEKQRKRVLERLSIALLIKAKKKSHKLDMSISIQHLRLSHWRVKGRCVCTKSFIVQ